MFARAAVLLLSAGLVACVSSTPPAAPAPARPLWLAQPSPAPIGELRCYRESANDAPSKDEGLAVARQRALARIVSDVKVTVRSEQIAYQAEENGKLTVWVGESNVQRAMGNVWDVVERNTYLEPAAAGRWDAYVQVCVKQSTFDEMRAALADQEQRELAFAAQKIDEARALLEALDLLAAIDRVELARGAIDGLPPSAPRSEAAGKLAELERRLETGLRASLAAKAPPTVAPSPSASLRLPIIVTFEGKPAPAIVAACTVPSGSCSVVQATDPQGRVDLEVEGVRTIGLRGLDVAIDLLRAHRPPRSLAKLTLAVKPPNRSVILCGGAIPESVPNALAKASAIVVDGVACTEKDLGAFGRIIVEVAEARTSCREDLGDWRCTAELSATLRDALSATKIETVKTSRSFIHPKEVEARAEAVGDALGPFSTKIASAVMQYARRLEQKSR